MLNYGEFKNIYKIGTYCLKSIEKYSGFLLFWLCTIFIPQIGFVLLNKKDF